MKVFFAALFVVGLILGSSVATRLISSDDLHKLFLRIAKNEGSQEDSRILQDVFKIYRSTTNAMQRQSTRGRESLKCLICRSGLAAYFDMIREGATDDTIIDSIETMCTSLGILRPESCRGVLELNVPIFRHIIKTIPEAAPRTFCALVLQNNDDPDNCVIQDSRFEWTVDLPEHPNLADIKNVDVVYYMGDSIDHHVWETTYNLINEMNGYVVDSMRQEFRKGVQIIPTIGNHESQPTNQFAPITVKGDKLNTTWLYESLARKWDYYLTEEAKASIRKMGAFSMLLRPGLRVISLNTNVAYRYNWWLVYDPLDSKQHLDWLIEELSKAELAGERVHILTHMPPGIADLTHTWTREYNRIVNRFSATIVAEFNGHTHSDEFKIFYSDAGAPVNVAWGTGSATSYRHYNLNYKIASFDPQTFEPVNIANYIYNLTEANLSPHRRPRWFQLYDIKKTFGLPDLSAGSMDELVKGMVTHKPFLLELYSAFFSKKSDTRWPNCDDECKVDQVCKTVVTVLWEREKCNELRRLFYS